MENEMIRTTALAVGYGNKVVVSDVNLRTVSGKVCCLIGPNGSGKSTVLRTLAGMQPALSGEVFLCGRPLERYTLKERAGLLSVVLTEQPDMGLFTAFEIVLAGRIPFTGVFGKIDEIDREIALRSLCAVSADHLASREFESLSDGEKQKVMIARALSQNPKVIVLDEPTSHLDIRHRVELMKILKRLAESEGVSVLMAVHDIELALKTADEVSALKDGRVVFQGSGEELHRKIDISSVYDLTSSAYSPYLGSIEVRCVGEPRVAVVGGGRSAVGILRELVKNGISAVLLGAFEGEVDYEAAETMGLRIVENTGGKDGLYNAVREIAESVAFVVVTEKGRARCSDACSELFGCGGDRFVYLDSDDSEGVYNIVRRLK